MKAYNPIDLNQNVSYPDWAKGFKPITIRDLTDEEIEKSDKIIYDRSKMLRERREKCNQDSRSLASSTLCRD